MNEKEFDDLLKVEETELHDDKELRKKLNRQLNAHIFKRSLITLIVIVLVVAASLFGISKTMDHMYYNPNEKNTFTKDMTDFDFLMYIYTSLYYPELEYLPVSDDQHESFGFGHYMHYGKIFDKTKTLYWDNKYNVAFDFKRSKVTQKEFDEDTKYVIHGNQFIDLKHRPKDYEYRNITDEMREEIASLPESARIEVSISFPRKSLEEVVAFMNTYNDSDYYWIAMARNDLAKEDYRYSYTPCGISLTHYTYPQLNEATKKAYPKYQELNRDGDDRYSAKELEDSYKTSLEILANQSEFVDMMYLDVESKLEDVKKNGVEAMGIFADMSKKDMVQFMQEHPEYSVFISDVSLSKYVNK